jgi:hypothetical protein
VTPAWRRQLRCARNGGLDRIGESGRRWLAELGLVRRRGGRWRGAFAVVGAAAAGALLLAWLTRGHPGAES